MSKVNRYRRCLRSSLKVNLSYDTRSIAASDDFSNNISNTNDIFTSNLEIPVTTFRSRDATAINENYKILESTVLPKNKQIYNKSSNVNHKRYKTLDIRKSLNTDNEYLTTTANSENICINEIHNVHKENKTRNKTNKEQKGKRIQLRSDDINYHDKNEVLLKSTNIVKANSDDINNFATFNDKLASLLTASENEVQCSILPVANSTMISDKLSGIEECAMREIENCSPIPSARTLPGTTFPLCNILSQGSNECLENDGIDINNGRNTSVEKASVNVNTSIDELILKSSKDVVKNPMREECEKTEVAKKNMHPDILKEVHGSIDIICTSLEVNVSSCSLNELQEVHKDIGESACTSTHADDNYFNEQNNLNEVGNNCHDNVMSDKATSSKSLSLVSSDRSHIEGKSEENQNVMHKFPVKTKKKLLPLQECSQLLTFSPVEEEWCHPPCRIFGKPYKNKREQYHSKNNNMKMIQPSQGKDENLNKKKNVSRPKIVTNKEIILRKIHKEDVFKNLVLNKGDSKEKNANINLIKRISSNDFQSLKTLPDRATLTKKTKKIVIVVTGFSNENKCLIEKMVKSLGFAHIEPNVTKHTSHVVSTGVRTINLLHGIVRGCWIVNYDWVLKSFEYNAWLKPEKYEMKNLAKAVVENRKDRQLFGKSYVPELFAACGYMYVDPNAIPSHNILKNLIKAAGGFITEVEESAKIFIGPGGLKETWIVDCITTGELQSFKYYQPPK